MINMHFVQGYGYKKILKCLNHQIDIKTIRRYCTEYAESLEKGGKEAADHYLYQEVRYKSISRPRTKLTPEIRTIIEECVNDNLAKKENLMGKQMMRKTDIFELLRNQGFTEISYQSVCKYAMSYSLGNEDNKPKPQECFIRQYYRPGELCEFDWGEVKLVIGGQKVRFRMAAFALCYSNNRRAYLFVNENTVSFMESHRNYFHDMGRVPVKMVYDNMKVAVRKYVGTTKEPTDALLRMSSFYEFRYRFANAHRGNEKGHVERSVEFIRRKAFSTVYSFATMEEAQAHLDAVCHRLNHTVNSDATEDIIRRSAEDIGAMHPCREDMGCFEMLDYHVDKYCTFKNRDCFYSVPDHLVGKTVSVKAYGNKLEVFFDNKIVAVHDVRNGRRWCLDISHYLNTMGMKPGAVPSSEALRQAPQEIQNLFGECFAGNPRDFVSLLKFARKNGFDYHDILFAYHTLKSQHIKNIGMELIRATMMPTKVQNREMQTTDTGKGIEDYAEEQIKEITKIMAAQIA